MLLWYPYDTCPSGHCAIHLEKLPDGSTDWNFTNAVVGLLCPYHQSMKNTHGLDDRGVCLAIRQSQRVREAARKIAKAELGLNKNHPGVPFRKNMDGSFTLLTSIEELSWSLEDGSPGPLPTINNAARNRIRISIPSAISLVEQTLGTNISITVE